MQLFVQVSSVEQNFLWLWPAQFCDCNYLYPCGYGLSFCPIIAVLSLELGMILTFSMFGFGELLMAVLFLMFSRAFLRRHNLGQCQGNT